MISIFFIAGSFPHFFWSTGCLQMHLLRPTPEARTSSTRALDDLGQMLAMLPE
jgi:hypothetical protein